MAIALGNTAIQHAEALINLFSSVFDPLQFSF
jgi:hypothetical protein